MHSLEIFDSVAAFEHVAKSDGVEYRDDASRCDLGIVR
jgi:hypothetical protein